MADRRRGGRRGAAHAGLRSSSPRDGVRLGDTPSRDRPVVLRTAGNGRVHDSRARHRRSGVPHRRAAGGPGRSAVALHSGAAAEAGRVHRPLADRLGDRRARDRWSVRIRRPRLAGQFVSRRGDQHLSRDLARRDRRARDPDIRPGRHDRRGRRGTRGVRRDRAVALIACGWVVTVSGLSLLAWAQMRNTGVGVPDLLRTSIGRARPVAGRGPGRRRRVAGRRVLGAPARAPSRWRPAPCWPWRSPCSPRSPST